MTAPMTPSRLEEIRFAVERAKSDADREDLHPDDEINHVVGLELLEEIDRLHALPVMDVCNRCDDCMPTDHDTGEAECTHPKIVARPVVANAAPPSWCPLRGGGR